MKAYMGLLLALALGAAVFQANGDPARQLAVRLIKHDDIVLIEVENISDRDIPITDLDIAGGRNSALRMYLYDPSRKHLQTAYATSFPSLSAPAKAFKPLARGEVRAVRYRREEIERYFARVPHCYFLVAAYRDSRRERISSPVSNAVKVCTPTPRP